MKIQEALDLTDQMRPNMMTRKVKIAYLREIDQLIWEEILMKHEHTAEQETQPEYDTDTAAETEMIVPDPYSMLYVYWLMSKIDLLNMEMDKYNNDRTLFDNAYDNMTDWWTRTKRPIIKTGEFWL